MTVSNSSIRSRAMLADLTISVWQGGITDKQVSREVAEQHGSKVNRGHYWKRLVDRVEYKPVNAAIGRLYNFHIDHTLPWGKGKERIFPSAMYWDYTKGMSDRKREVEAAFDVFVAKYPQMKEEARRDLNGLYNEGDFPTQAEVRSKFAVLIPPPMPLPSAEEFEDFRADLGDEVVDQLREDWDAERSRILDSAVNTVYTRITDVLTVMVSRLRDYDPTRKGERFYDSWVENVASQVAILPALNITDDARLTAIGQRIERELLAFAPSALKANAADRSVAVDAGEAILKEMEAFLG